MSQTENIAHILMVSLEMGGIGVIAAGAVISTIAAISDLFREQKDAYLHYRRRLSRAILLGLEFLVAADIIRTVVIDLNINSIGVLALLIIIRTFLSFTLEVEISGRWPWQSTEGKPIGH